jgi:hypothetical protein
LLARVNRLLATPLGDVLVVATVVALHASTLGQVWARLQPFGSPTGPDSDDVLLAAVALETGRAAIYPAYRYPTYSWLVSALSPDARSLAEVGQAVSMAGTWVSGLAAYLLARAYGGRVAGVVAASLVLRLPGVVDLGRTFTPYGLITTLDLAGICALAWLARGWLVAAVPLAVAVAGLFGSDPKQIPVALALCGLGMLVAPLARGWRGLGVSLLLAGVIPATNHAIATHIPPLLSMEEVTTRVSLGLDVDPDVYTDGWSPGEPLTGLPATLERMGRGVRPPVGQGWMSRSAYLGLAAQLPETSILWLGVGGLLPIALLVRGRRWRTVLPALAPLPGAVVAFGTLHLYYQHRYMTPATAVLPPVVVGAAGALLGPWGAAGLGSALFLPGSPWRGVGPGVLQRGSQDTDQWCGVETPDVSQVTARMDDTLPADARVFDFSPFRPWTFVAPLRRYTPCKQSRDQCRSEWAGEGAVYVVADASRQSSSPDIPKAADLATGGCWTARIWRHGNGTLFEWTCDTPPVAPPMPRAEAPSRLPP